MIIYTLGFDLFELQFDPPPPNKKKINNNFLTMCFLHLYNLKSPTNYKFISQGTCEHVYLFNPNVLINIYYSFLYKSFLLSFMY